MKGLSPYKQPGRDFFKLEAEERHSERKQQMIEHLSQGNERTRGLITVRMSKERLKAKEDQI